MSSVLQFLDMGTWTVTGDFRRVYRGPNLEYTGWQRSSITTPDALFGAPISPQEDQPFWARIMEGPEEKAPEADCTPEESRQILLDHLTALFPAEREALSKII